MDIFYIVLDWINIIFIAFTSLSMIVQLFYMISAFFCKKVVFSQSEKISKVCIIIPARNEEGVIAKIIKSSFAQTYTEGMIEVLVVAHNCTDNTAAVAKDCGAKVIEFNSESKIKGAALKHAIDTIGYTDYDFFIVFDADTMIDPLYTSKMNDAYNSGVHVARGFINTINTFASALSCVAALYNIRDARITARVREKLHMNAQLVGNGMMFSSKLLTEFGTFPSNKSLVEDVDFMTQAMLKGYRCHYVEDAILFEEQSEKVKDLFGRNMRIGKGINKLFWTKGHRLIGKFFTTGKPTYIDMFLTFSFIPISLISCIWFPIYYIFLILKMIITGMPVLHMGTELSLTAFIPMAIIVVCIMFVMLTMQGVITLFLQRDRLLKDIKLRKYAKGVLLMTPIMLLTNVAITCGVLNPKQKWSTVTRIDSTKENASDNSSIDKITIEQCNLNDSSDCSKDNIPCSDELNDSEADTIILTEGSCYETPEEKSNDILN